MSDARKLSAGEIDAIIAGCRNVTPGPWKVYDGSSWRRIGTVDGRYDDCAVLAPIVASDGHPDMCAGRGQDTCANLHHIARLDPATVLALATLALDGIRMRTALELAVKQLEALGSDGLASGAYDALGKTETHSGTDE